MPAKSKSQRNLMGMVYAYKTGELSLTDVPPSLRNKIKRIAKNISVKSARDYAKTKGLSK